MLYNEDKLSEQWLVKLLMEMECYFGFGKKLNTSQTIQLAQHITKKYSWLKVSEMMLFFLKCKSVEFGEFFGQIDPQRVMTFLVSFLEYRNELVMSVMEEIEQKYAEWHRHNVIQNRCLEAEITKFRKDKYDKEKSINKALLTDREKDAILDSANSLVNNIQGFDKSIIEKMCANWAKKYGCTPQEYIIKNEK